MKHARTPVRLAVLSSLCLLFAGTFALPALAATAPTSSVSQSVTQAYGTDGDVQKGMIVRLKDGDSSKVVPLDQQHSSEMQGVVVAANDAAVTLGNPSPDSKQVYVATFGRYDVLVSNQNGPIKVGDYITISSLNGIGMKADNNESIVLGKAETAFNGTANVESSTTVKDASGQTKGVSIGRISLTITVAHNPLQKRTTSTFPGVFQDVGSGIANKPVSAPRIYLAMAVLLISTIIAGSLLYSSVRSGVVSIGRNPLAKKSIIRGMFQVILVSIIVFIIGLFAVYLLLRL